MSAHANSSLPSSEVSSELKFSSCRSSSAKTASVSRLLSHCCLIYLIARSKLSRWRGICSCTFPFTAGGGVAGACPCA